MKRNLLMARGITRPVICLLSLLLILAGLAVPTLAAERPYVPDPDYTIWEYNAATGEVTGYFLANDVLDEPCRVTYRVYDGAESKRLYTMPTGDMLEYENRLTAEGRTYTMFTTEYAGDHLIMRDGEEVIILFSDGGVRDTEAMIRDGAHSIHRIFFYDEAGALRITEPDNVLVRAITALSDSSAEAEELKLSDLRFAPSYELVGYMNNTWVGLHRGNIYRLGDAYYYLDLAPYEDQIISADGDIDYTADLTVALHPIPNEFIEDLRQDIDQASRNRPNYESESSIAATPPETIIVLTVFCGLLLPIAPLTVGLCKTFSRRGRGKRRWPLLAAMGGVWMLSGLLILVLMCIAL